MTNIFINLWESWSTFEKVREGTFLFLIFAIILIATHFDTKEKRMTILIAISLLISAILNIIGIYLSSTILKIDITEIFRLTPVITGILLVSNLGLLIGFYITHKDKKDFQFEQVRAEYFSDTIKQSLFLILLIFAMLLFVSLQTKAILLTCIVSTLLPIWFTYWASKRLLS